MCSYTTKHGRTHNLYLNQELRLTASHCRKFISLAVTILNLLVKDHCHLWPHFRFGELRASVQPDTKDHSHCMSFLA